jgi:hypothetical protein
VITGDRITYTDCDGTHTAHVLHVTEGGLIALQRADEIIYRQPRHVTPYTAEDREQWRAEIREAKRTMTKEEFAEWLTRRMNTVGPR